MKRGRAASTAWIVTGLLASAAQAVAPGGDQPRQPDFTSAQATSGRTLFDVNCSSCHGANLMGAAAPALKGPGFAARWANGHRTVKELLTQITNTMPRGAPHSLSVEQYEGITAFVLASNGYTSGDVALSSTSAGWALAAPPGMSPSINTHVRPDLPMPPPAVLSASSSAPDDAELAHPDEADWLMYNKDYSSQRFSKLGQITTRNATHLAPACLFQAGEIGNFQAAPIVYKRTLYLTTPYNTFALDARTCQKKWEHRYSDADDSLAMVLSRGMALYRGKLFRTTPNGHLLALDAENGKLLWDVWMSDKERGYWLTGAPIAYDGKVFMGTAGADWGADGFIYAFDAQTGQRLWTFDVIPTGQQPGADTWKQGAEHGGGSFWSTFTLDPQSGLILASIGNPAPDYDGALRPGDNLYTDSVVALDIHTGKIAWWLQQVPHDVHDWDTAAAPTLYQHGGHSYLAVPSKDGWLYVYDRNSRELRARGEISPHKNVDVPLGTEPVYHCPGISGGAAWNGAAYYPPQNLLLVNSLNWCGTTRLTQDGYVEGASYFKGDHTWDPPESARGFTRALDATTGKVRWLRDSNTPMVAALTATAGGVVFTGDIAGNFLVLGADNGRTLYSFNTGGAVAGAPSTYLVDGKQYVAMASGNSSRIHWGTTGSMTLIVFTLAP